MFKNMLSDCNKYLKENEFIYLDGTGWIRKRLVINLEYNMRFIKVIVMKKVSKNTEKVVEINITSIKHFKKIINRAIVSKRITKNTVLGRKPKKKKYMPKDAMSYRYPGSFESGR